jgi:hypothetical protein
MIVATVDFVRRALAIDNKDGFEIVFSGKVELTHNKLSVFEYEDYKENPKTAKPVFETYLFNITSIRCSPLKSGHDNFLGGVVQIFGHFDHGTSERISLKMGKQYYDPLIAALKASLNRKRP